jgi:hypothetical protein
MGDVWTTPTLESAMKAGEGLPMGRPGEEETGFLESIGLGWKRARAAPDWGFNQRNYEEQIAFDLYEPLLKAGYVTRPLDDSLAARIGRSFRGKEDPFWAAVAKAQADGLKLPHPAVLDARSMAAEARRLRRVDMEAADRGLANGSTAGALTGELLAGLADPTSYLPVGGTAAKGASFARSVLTMGRNEAFANLGLGIAMEPLIRDDAQQLGVKREAVDTAADLGVQTGAGFVLGGLGGGIEHVLGGRARPVPVHDGELAREFETLVPRARQTGEEKAAVSMIEQASAEQRASPFVSGPAGDDMHGERMARARDWAFGLRLPPPQPVRRFSPAEVAGGVSANLRHGERSRYRSMVRAAESAGNDRAQAGTSTAYGRYQVIKSTWLNWYQQRYPGTGLTPEQIYAKRADGALQEVFMDDFTAANARALRAAGVPETADNLYLAHFLGPSDAARVLSADPNAPIAGLVRGKSIAANRSVLEGKTAGEVREWAARKMGGEASAAAEVADAMVPATDIDVTPLTRPRAESDPWARMSDEVPAEGWIDDADMPRLRPDLFTTPEAHARAQIAMEADVDAQEGFDVLVRWTDADEAATGAIGVAPKRAAAQGPMDLLQFLASKGGIRDGEGHDLKGMFDGNPLVPGRGRLVRDTGLSIDDAVELAAEAGYFGGRAREDVTIADLLDAMDQQYRGGRRMMTDAGQSEVDARAQALQADAQYQEFADRLGEAAAARGLDMPSDAETMRAFDLWDGQSFDRTLDRMIAEKLNDAMIDPADEAAAFRWRDPGEYFAPPRAQQLEEAGALPAHDLAPWDDPDGVATDMQLMSLEHDLRIWADTEPDMAFVLTEGDEPRSLADIMAEIEEEDAVIAAIEACL